MSIQRTEAISDLKFQVSEIQLAQQDDMLAPEIEDETATEVEPDEETLQSSTDNVVEDVKNQAIETKLLAMRLNKWLGNIPTPGDIWLPFWILIILFAAIFPVDTHTRLRWMWLVFTGNARLPLISGGGTTSTTQTAPSTTQLSTTNISTTVPLNTSQNTSYLDSLYGILS